MSKTRRVLLVALLVAIPLIASACVIDLGIGGCKLYIEEPGIANGVFCPL